MTVYNKLKIAILAIMTSQTISAITIDPIQVQSGSGDLLYAEMKFSNANPNEKIEVGLADADDIQHIGITTQAPGHLNFYTRRSGDGTGVIVITSSRPIVESELNILLKVKEGSATHIQQVRTPLTRGRNNIPTPMVNANAKEQPLKPQIIVSEKDIALNLPTSTQYQVTTPQTVTSPTIKKSNAVPDTQQSLAISVIAPPPLKTEQNTEQKTAVTNSVSSQNSTSVAVNKDDTHSTVVANPQVVIQPKPIAQPEKSSQQTQTAHTPAPKTEPQKIEKTAVEHKSEKANTIKPKTDTQKASQKNKPTANNSLDKAPRHVVRANESLWKIASRIAAETHQSVPEVMRQIKENNADAFIQGDINRIRRGVALNLAASYQQVPQTKSKVPPKAPQIAKKQSGSAKYRLDQAEMSLVADNEQSSAQGSAKQNTQLNQTTAELSTKVMTSREKTVKLQKNVTQLASALQEKNQRIQLLNARLAQLQQQLQQQNVKKPNS
ncbi:FimV family protein [Acinetobacter bereziniae]|uniref:type IV pilus assembly protein FimV n=1 Tax=Acinetobacter bereziniae TaxID=106648 RepID=UPI0039C134FA